MHKNLTKIRLAFVSTLCCLLALNANSATGQDKAQDNTKQNEEQKQGTARVGIAEINDADELNITIAGETLSYNFGNIAIVNAKGDEIPVNAAKAKFEKATPVIFYENPELLAKMGEVFAEDAIVIYYPLTSYLSAKKASAIASEKASKFKAIINCVYEDESTKLAGMTEITSMKINGQEVANNEATIKGDLIQFSRKHTKSQVHIFGLKPGEYEIEFVAEATFGGKFYKTKTGKGKFKVEEGDVTGVAIFPGTK